MEKLITDFPVFGEKPQPSEWQAEEEEEAGVSAVMPHPDRHWDLSL